MAPFSLEQNPEPWYQTKIQTSAHCEGGSCASCGLWACFGACHRGRYGRNHRGKPS